MATNALRIAEDGTFTEHEVPVVDGSHLQGLRDLIGGGWIEGFAGAYGAIDDTFGVWAYCDEDGRAKGLPENMLASILMGHAAPTLVGPIIFVMPDDMTEDGEEVGCPPIPAATIAGIRDLATIFSPE